MATLQEENDLFAAPGSRNLDVALIPRRTFVHVEPEEAVQRGSGGIRRAKMRFVSRAWKRDKPGQIAIEVFFLNSLFIGIEREPPLAGQWRFSLDANKEGIQKEYFNRDLAGLIALPGSTDEAHLGAPNPARPSLDGLFRLYVYEGPAGDQRDVEIPAAWRGKQVVLFLERCHWDTRVWVDARYIGAQDSLIAPHVYDLGTTLAPRKHRLTICVDNTKKIDLGRFVSINYEGTQTNWNGLIGKLELRAKDPVSIEDVEVYPDVARKTAKLSITVANVTGHPVDGKLTLSAALHPAGVKVPAQIGRAHV